jgi:glucose-1-phosphate thymidylyltransferase
MLAGIKDILIITSNSEADIFKRLFRDQNLGVNLEFAVQSKPAGIAQAFQIAQFHYGHKMQNYDRTCLVLGDNFFYGAGFTGMLQAANTASDSAVVFAVPTREPQRFGVVEILDQEIDGMHIATGIEEKPKKPKSNLAVTGLYFYPNDVYKHVENLKPSARGELEITDVNRIYLNKNKLRVIVSRRGMTWFDTGTPDSLLEAAHFVQTLQKQQNVLIGSPHEVSYSNGWLNKEELLQSIALFEKTGYGEYLKELADHV